MKVRSLYELETILDQDLSWRRREFTTIKFLVEGARRHQKVVLMKAGIALLYSHWEGHVKKASEAYLCYLMHLSPQYGDMTDNFAHLSLADKFSEGFSINNYKSQKEIFDYIKTGLTEKFEVNEKLVVDAESNLKSQVLSNIMNKIGLDYRPFELKEMFIDSIMLKVRNHISHGDRIDETEIMHAYDEMEKELLNMIVTFQNLIRTAASNKDYLKK